MSSNELKEGDLVYIPQSVRLFFYRDRSVGKYMQLKLPRHMLVTEATADTDLIGVLYDGETWHVKAGDVYPLIEATT